MTTAQQPEQAALKGVARHCSGDHETKRPAVQLPMRSRRNCDAGTACVDRRSIRFTNRDAQARQRKRGRHDTRYLYLHRAEQTIHTGRYTAEKAALLSLSHYNGLGSSSEYRHQYEAAQTTGPVFVRFTSRAT